MTYAIKYRRRGQWFWRTLRRVVGHFYDHQSVQTRDAQQNSVVRQPQDRMVVYFEDGSLYAIPRWSECELRLGTDWTLFTKREMEKQGGQPVTLNVTPNR